MSDKRSFSTRAERLVPILLGVILAAMLIVLIIIVAVFLGVWPH